MEPLRTSQGIVGRAIRRHVLVAKLVVIALILLVLLIPLARLGSLVDERQERRSEAVSGIIGQWGGEQTVAGPILVVPYVARSTDEKGHRVETVQKAFFLPDTLLVEGSLQPLVRSRGIYDATLYEARLRVSGSFRVPDWSGWRISPADVQWEEARVAVELPDMRALRERAALQWGDMRSSFRPGTGDAGLFGGGIDAPVSGLSAALRAGGKDAVPFSFELALQGGGSLTFLPLGNETMVRIRSPWKSPSFGGGVPAGFTRDHRRGVRCRMEGSLDGARIPPALEDG